MHKLLYKLGFPIFLLFNSSFAYANQISDISIEGFSIGDSLIDFIEEDEILRQAQFNKKDYHYLREPNKFSHIYFYSDFPTYDYVSFFVKTGNRGGDYSQIKKHPFILKSYY